MDDEVPKGWAKRRVDEIAAVVGGTTPSRKHPEYFVGTIPWVTPSDVTRLHGRYLDTSSECVSDEAVKSVGLQVLPPGTVLLTSRATIGATAIAKRPVTTNQGLQNLVPFEGTDPLWLYYQMRQRKADLDALAGGSTFREFSRQSLRALRLLVPPPDEQRGIARVLDAIDEAIEKTEAVIAATEQVRKALLQELLTRGVPGWHTEWKTVPGIGTIPACWEVVTVDRVAKFASGLARRAGDISSSPDGGSVPVYGGNGIAGYADIPLIAESVVVIGRVGAKCGVVHVTDGPAWVTDNALYSRDLASSIDVRFLGLLLAEANLNERRTGNAQPLLTQTIVGAVTIALPSMGEQQSILASLAGIRARQTCERREIQALRDLKARAADALLSGRVRVPVGDGQNEAR